jgi:hypothetical protein
MERTACQEFREEQIMPGAAASEHAHGCATCARWAARLVVREELVRSLPRFAAPMELEGLVVGAVQAGARQDRAVRALSRLSRVQPPKELDHAVADVTAGPASGLRATAPQVLDRLVAEELADPAKARSRRFIGSLPRLAAPTALAQCVESAVATALRPAAPSRTRFARAVFAVAALILAVAVPILVQYSGHAAAERPFRIERIGSVGALDPLSHDMLDAASGGLLRLHKI